MNIVVPKDNSNKGKKEQISEMFDDISPKYDALNRLLSLGIDKIWRKNVVKILAKHNPKKILDIATGTADLAIAESKLNPEKIIGVDISEGMLAVGREKIKKLNQDKLIELAYGDSENLKYDDNSFDAITVAFGVRNFENLLNGLKEMHRVVNNNGIVVILEFSQPANFPFKQVYSMYFKYVLPIVGNTVSKSENAYTYLPKSVYSFPYGEQFCSVLKEAGFTDCKMIPQTFGICTIYTAKK